MLSAKSARNGSRGRFSRAWLADSILCLPSTLIRDWQFPLFIFTILFLGFTLVSLLQDVLRTPNVTLDTIYGAVTVYLLIAYVWGVAYLLLETLQPGALAMNATWHPNHKIDWPDCMFFSFVTLTSVGYGDMVPITPHARSLSILEGVSGIMYVAVLVARLVGLYSAGKTPVRPIL